MSRRLVLPVLAFSILVAPAASRAEEGEGPPFGVGGGETRLEFKDLGTAEDKDTKKKSNIFVGRNVSKERFKDFELELTGCGPDAKFKRIKVYPKAKFDENGDVTDVDSKSDWDVDDDGSGLSDQQYTPDPAVTEGPNPGRANEADNVDETPGTQTRVDANGHLESTGQRGRGVPPHAEAVKNNTEDPQENNPGDPQGKKPPEAPDVSLNGVGGVQPGDGFIIEFDLTAEPKGDECVFALVPSTVGGRRVALLDEGTKPGLAPGEEYAAVTPDSSPSRAFTGFEVAFTPGFSFGSIATQQENTFDGKSNGKNIHYDRANLHGDVRYYAGSIGGLRWFRPVVGLKGAGTLGGAERGLVADNHPPLGIDSFLDYEIKGTLTPFVGLVLADFDCSRVNLLAGPRITFAEITGITDESGGGGVRERFRRNVVQVGPAFGVELDVPLPFTRHAGFEAGVRVAGWGEYLPGTHVSGSSSTFPFDYRFETEGAFLGTVRGGFYARFGGFEF